MLAAVAQLPAPGSAQSVGWLVLTIFAFAGGTYYVIEIWQKVSGKGHRTSIADQPVEVREAARLATREELADVKQDLTKQAASRKGIYEKLENHGSRISALEQDRLNARAELGSVKIDLQENTKLTSEMRGEVRAMNQSIQNLTSSLTQFLQNQAKK